MAETVDIEAYKNSLETIMQIYKISEPFDIVRVAEMSQRTNQFNLSGRRYSESEIAELINDANHDVYALTASDKFGSLGIIAAAVILQNDNTAIIESFYLSCRAFSRGFEYELIEHIKSEAKKNGCTTIVGVYSKTNKNGAHEKFYAECGIGDVNNEQEYTI